MWLIGEKRVMEGMEGVLQYILKYGVLMIFILTYLEQLNVPGLASSIIMPAVGVVVAKYNYSFIFIFLISLFASVLGSLTLQYLGYFVGAPIIEWLKRKFTKTEKTINKVIIYTNKYGSKGVLICRLIPGVRTLVSLVSGTVREKMTEFLIYSSIGIAIWNFLLMVSGYLTIVVISR